MSQTPKRPATPFQQSWPLSYGIEITESDATTKQVKSVLCRFCKYFGHQPVYDAMKRKRKPTAKMKYFSPPWRTDIFTQHMEAQHPEYWKEYLAADECAKRSFFDDHMARSKTTMLR
jgi:hypothetical protein